MIQLRVGLRGKETQEPVQPLTLQRVELPREIQEPPHVGHALWSARFRQQLPIVIQKYVIRLRIGTID